MKKNVLNFAAKALVVFNVFHWSTVAEAASSYKLALNWKAEPQFGGFYEAKRAGHFKAEKIDVEVLEGGSGTPTVQMLANNKVDFAIVSAEEILIQNDRNPKSPVVAVYASFQTNPQIIMTHAEKNYTGIKDVIQGSGVLALQSGLSYAQFLLKKLGPAKVKIVPYQGGVANFLADKNFSQQGFLTSEPLAAEKSGAQVKSFLVADEGFNPYTTVVAVRAEFLKKNRAQVKSVVQAIREGWMGYLKDPSMTNEMMGQINKAMDSETFKKSAEAQVPLILNKLDRSFILGRMSQDRFKELGEQMKSLGFIKKASDAKTVFENL